MSKKRFVISCMLMSIISVLLIIKWTGIFSLIYETVHDFFIINLFNIYYIFSYYITTLQKFILFSAIIFIISCILLLALSKRAKIRRLIGLIVGYLIGVFLYLTIYNTIIGLSGGYDSIGYHNFMKYDPSIQSKLWVIAFFVSSIIAGYIAKEKGRIVGLLSASPMSCYGILLLFQALNNIKYFRFSLIFSGGMVLFSYLGGWLGESLALGRFDKMIKDR